MATDDPVCECGQPFSAHGLESGCTMFHEPQPPRRSCFLSLKIGADDREELAFGLRALADDIAGEMSPGPFVTGGYTLGYTGELTVNPEMTNAAYFEAIERYHQKRKQN